MATFVAYLKALFPGWIGWIFAAVDILGIWQFAQAVRGRSTLADAPAWVWGLALFGTFFVANYLAFGRLKRDYDRQIEKKKHRAYFGTLAMNGQNLNRLIRAQMQGGFATPGEFEAYLAWIQSVEGYLRENLDASYLARFSLNAGVNLLIGQYPSRQMLSADLAIRLDRLASMINDFSP